MDGPIKEDGMDHILSTRVLNILLGQNLAVETNNILFSFYQSFIIGETSMRGRVACLKEWLGSRSQKPYFQTVILSETPERSNMADDSLRP